MKTWTDTTYQLDATSHLSVTEHKDTVALHAPGYVLDGRGFCVLFTVEQLSALKKLVYALEFMQDKASVRALAVAQQAAREHAADVAVLKQGMDVTIMPWPLETLMAQRREQEENL